MNFIKRIGAGGGARPTWADTTPGTVTGAANVGTGTGLVFRNMAAGILNFKTLKAGANVLLTNNADDVTIGANGFSEFQYYADQLDSPNSPDWKVNSLAPAASDTVNSGLTVRKFDDTGEEGTGFILEIPAGAVNIIFNFRGRAETAPGVAKQVRLKLYSRDIPDNAAVSAWSAGVDLTLIDIPTNSNFQYDTQTLTLAALGLTAGRVTQFELTRNGADAADTLSGDYDLIELKISFS